MENEEEILQVPPKAQVYIDMLDKIDFKIDEFIDLHLLGAIRAEVEEDKKSEFLKGRGRRTISLTIPFTALFMAIRL